MVYKIIASLNMAFFTSLTALYFPISINLNVETNVKHVYFPEHKIIDSMQKFDFDKYNNKDLIEPGNYEADESLFYGSSIRLIAKIPGTVHITIKEGKYFLKTTSHINAVFVSGIKFDGGLGAFKFQNSGPNVNQSQLFENNEFINYSECAISNSSSDSPFLIARNNVFIGLSGSQTIGISWGGYLDGSEISGNLFERNAYHLVLGPRLSGRFLISFNQFLSFGGTKTLADIWIKPTNENENGNNSGQGAIFFGNSFGNENINTSSPRILIANEENFTGSDRSNRRPSQLDAGSVTGLTFLGGRVSAVSGMNAPFIRSYITKFDFITMRDLKFDGGSYTYIVEYMDNSRQVYKYNSNFEFNASDTSNHGMPPALAFSNKAINQLLDNAGFWRKSIK
jgi:hypothetical protein